MPSFSPCWSKNRTNPLAPLSFAFMAFFRVTSCGSRFLSGTRKGGSALRVASEHFPRDLNLQLSHHRGIAGGEGFVFASGHRQHSGIGGVVDVSNPLNLNRR